MANTDAVDAALVAVLSGDATLSALMPDGVYFDVATPNARKFIVVTLLLHTPTEGFDDHPLYEDSVYLIEAVTLAPSGVNSGVNDAADRIHALLHRQPLSLGSGLTWMQTLRTRRTRPPAIVDATDADLRWQRRGGQYQISVSPN